MVNGDREYLTWGSTITWVGPYQLMFSEGTINLFITQDSMSDNNDPSGTWQLNNAAVPDSVSTGFSLLAGLAGLAGFSLILRRHQIGLTAKAG
jgi:hypothetical protein